MNFEDLVQTFEDLFQLSDEELERAKPVIIDELSQSLTGANAIIAIDEYLRICDLAAYTPEQYQADLEAGKAECFRVISKIKEDYASSAIKTEILDMTYSLVETYFGMVALRAKTPLQVLNSFILMPSYPPTLIAATKGQIFTPLKTLLSSRTLMALWFLRV